MIKVNCYIKTEDDFVPIEDFQGNFPDPEYIDSAMELTINGTSIISRLEWDYMDDLWGYISTGFEDLIEKSEWKTYFPDQPIKLIFRLNKKNNQIEVESTPSRGLVKARADLNEFLAAMSEAGQKFFLRMAEIVPEKSDFYVREANRMRESVDKLKASSLVR